MSNNCEYCSYEIDEDNTCMCIGGDLRILKQENARLREALELTTARLINRGFDEESFIISSIKQALVSADKIQLYE